MFHSLKPMLNVLEEIGNYTYRCFRHSVKHQLIYSLIKQLLHLRSSSHSGTYKAVIEQYNLTDLVVNHNVMYIILTTLSKLLSPELHMIWLSNLAVQELSRFLQHRDKLLVKLDYSITIIWFLLTIYKYSCSRSLYEK